MAETTPVPTGEACFLCKSGGWSPVYDTAPYRVVKCDSCGLLRIAPMPDDVKSREINEDTYSAEEYRERYFKDRHNFAAWARAKLKLIERYKPGKGRLLDVGCSYGVFVEEAGKRGWDASGCEMNPVTGAHSRARFGEKVHVGGADGMPFPVDSFDVITLWDVIEHQADPAAFLKMLSRYLKADGLLFLQMPNFDSYISGLKKARWDWLTPGDHRYFFTSDTLARTAAAAGFVQIHHETWEPTRYFIDSLIGLGERSGFLAKLYRATAVRAVRIFFSFLFLPFQRRLAADGKGALLVSVLARERGQGD